MNFTDVNMLAVNPQIQVLTPSEIGLEDLWYNFSIENQHFVMCERPEGRILRVTCLLESVIPTLWNLRSRSFRKRLTIVVEGTYNLFIGEKNQFFAGYVGCYNKTKGFNLDSVPVSSLFGCIEFCRGQDYPDALFTSHSCSCSNETSGKTIRSCMTNFADEPYCRKPLLFHQKLKWHCFLLLFLFSYVIKIYSTKISN